MTRAEEPDPMGGPGLSIIQAVLRTGGDRNQLPVVADGEVINLLCHRLFEFVLVWLFPGFTEVHGVRVSSHCYACKGLDERMDAADGPI